MEEGKSGRRKECKKERAEDREKRYIVKKKRKSGEEGRKIEKKERGK